MNKLELRVIITAILTMAVFLFSVLRGVSKYSADVPECIPYDQSYLEPAIKQLDDSTYQVFMLAQMWSFEPNEIYVPVGSEVDFYLTSKDVVHGFHISDKSLNMMAVPGGVNKQTVKFKKPGVYKMVCHEYCGSGHQHMEGEIIVNYTQN